MSCCNRIFEKITNSFLFRVFVIWYILGYSIAQITYRNNVLTNLNGTSDWLLFLGILTYCLFLFGPFMMVLLPFVFPRRAQFYQERQETFEVVFIILRFFLEMLCATVLLTTNRGKIEPPEFFVLNLLLYVTPFVSLNLIILSLFFTGSILFDCIPFLVRCICRQYGFE